MREPDHSDHPGPRPGCRRGLRLMPLVTGAAVTGITGWFLMRWVVIYTVVEFR